MPFSPPAAAVLAGLLLVPLAAPAPDQWVRLNSSHFELYTTAGERKGREAILYFEQVRDFFSKVFPRSKALGSARVRVIAFRSEKEYKPFQPNQSAAAFYLAGYDRDYIVMQSITAENFPVAVHEFTHLLVKHTGIEVPLWFNEGLADLYSTLKPVGKKVQIGDLIPGHMVVLRENQWLPIEALVTVDRSSPYYNERDRAGVFYAESLALMHMLNLSPQYRPQFTKFVTALTSGLPAANAFWQTYARTTEQVLKDLEQYLRGSFSTAVFDIKLQKSDEEPDAEPASQLESGMALGDLLALSGKGEEATKRYESVAQQFPKRWEPEAGLAELAWREKDLERAKRHFTRAAELGSTNVRLYLDFAAVLHRMGLDDARVPVLKKAVELNPEYQEAHLELAYCLLRIDEYQTAADHFSKVKQVRRDQAFRYYQALAYAHYRLEKRDDARKAAEAARKFALNPEETATAEEMLRAIDSEPVARVVQPASTPELRPMPPPGIAPQPGSIPEDPDDDKPRRLVRRGQPPEVARVAPSAKTTRLSLTGTLLEIDCLGKVARLRVSTGEKRVAVAITNPEAVVVKGSPTGTLDLTCGPQKNTGLTLEYESRPDTRLGTIGVVRSIEFH